MHATILMMHVLRTRHTVAPVRLGQFTRRIDDASFSSLARFPRQVPFGFERGVGEERRFRFGI